MGLAIVLHRNLNPAPSSVDADETREVPWCPLGSGCRRRARDHTGVQEARRPDGAPARGYGADLLGASRLTGKMG